MLTPTRPWFLGLTVGLALGAVLGAATVSRSASSRGTPSTLQTVLDLVSGLRQPSNGETRLLFRDPTGADQPQTDVEDAPPALTARERDVLVALCRPLLARDMFTEPASTRTIADELVISDAAVKQHLTNLFDKFGIGTDDANRRLQLANSAIRSGAVTVTDLRGHEPT